MGKRWVLAAVVTWLGLVPQAAAAPGDRLLGFGEDGLVRTSLGTDSTWVADAVFQPDGNLLVVGAAYSRPWTEVALVRYRPDGSLDGTFGRGGAAVMGLGGGAFSEGTALALQPDGKIVVAVHGRYVGIDTFAVARFTPDGSLDPSFAGDGIEMVDFNYGAPQLPTSIEVQSDGKILVAGWAVGRTADNAARDHDFVVARFNSDGRLDPSFSDDGKLMIDTGDDDYGWSVVAGQEGKVILTGWAESTASQAFSRGLLLRYNDDGTPDPSFGQDGLVLVDIGNIDILQQAVELPNRKIVAAGFSDRVVSGTFTRAITVFQFSPDGSRDPSFSSDGLVTKKLGRAGVDDEGRRIVRQADGKLVVLARGDDYPAALLRYYPSGGLDEGFGDAGVQFEGRFYAQAVTLGPNDNIAAVGSNGVAQYEGGGPFDVTPPTVTVTCPAYPISLGGEATATVSASDMGSGLLTDPSGPLVVSGTSLGGHTLTVTAQDNDGNVGSGSCQYSVYDPNHASGTISPGETFETAPQTSDADPVTIAVTASHEGSSGPVTIDEQPATGTLDGYTLGGELVTIEVPAGSVTSPLQLRFRLDASVVPPGADSSTLQVFRDGRLVRDCARFGTATPDPCVSYRADLPDGGIEIVVLTSHASQWSFGLHEPFAFQGFLSPIDNPDILNRVRAGSGVPLRFSLGGEQDGNVLASGWPRSRQIACDSGAPIDDLEQTVAATESHLSYESMTGRYVYVWKTDGAWAGTCREFDLKLSDGSHHRAIFRFS